VVLPTPPFWLAMARMTVIAAPIASDPYVARLRGEGAVKSKEG
jgi:hypothetical protein